MLICTKIEGVLKERGTKTERRSGGQLPLQPRHSADSLHSQVGSEQGRGTHSLGTFDAGYVLINFFSDLHKTFFKCRKVLNLFFTARESVRLLTK